MNASGPFIAAFVLAVGLSASFHDAVACGEVLTRTGNALRYHSFVTRHPAQILLYSGPATQALSDGSRQRFHDNLERAGHKVTLVTNAAELASAFSARTYDVVITFASDLDDLSGELATAANQPTLIPVLQRDTPNTNELRQRYPHLLTDTANLNHFLKAIEQSMKARRA